MKLMAIDGNSLVNRAFYGVAQTLSTSDGQPTGAIYGFLTMLHKLLKEYKPEALCVTFDLKAPTFRHLAYKEYKAQRKPMPMELVSQLPILKEVLAALNIPCYAVEGWEADDLLGTIGRLNDQAQWETIIVTGDRDSLQLLTEKTSVHLITSKKTILYTPTVFEEEYGFLPIHLVDLKGLMGDTSDNIPGIKGLGEKTVTPLIEIFNTLDAIYEKLQDPDETLCLKPAALKKLREGEEMARLSHDLATIRCTAPLDSYNPQDNLIATPNEKELFQLLSQLELNKLIEYYNLDDLQEDVSAVLGTCDTEEVTRTERTKELLALWKGKTLSVLTLPQLAGIAILDSSEETGHCALFLETSYSDYGNFLKEFFVGDFQLQVHQSKQLQHELLLEGIIPTNITLDAEIAAYLLAPDDKEYSLETLGKRYLKFTPMSADLYTDTESFSPLSDRGTALGAWTTHTSILSALAKVFIPRIESNQLNQVMDEIELPLCAVLAQMEVTGITLDRAVLKTYGEKLEKRIGSLEILIEKEAGESFNISSPKQLGVILFEKLQLPVGKKTKTGYSTNVEVLEDLHSKYPEYPILGYVIEHRQLSKLHSTYVKGLQKVLTPQGKIHTTLKNTVTTTGRLSSTEPNLQNIPIRTPLGAELRHMFVAEPHTVLIDADYSQIELRLLAHLSGDETMISAFLSDEDFHAQTASKVFHIPLDEVDATMRRAAKAVNFGIVYGKKGFSLSQDIGVTVAEANQYISHYFDTYPKVKEFLDGIATSAMTSTCVTTLYGRKRWLANAKSSNKMVQNAAIREAQNMPMQGTAADIMKLAMIAVSDMLKDYPEAKLVLQIHDEIIVQCPESQSEELRQKIKETMENVADLSVPLLVEAEIGKSWGDAH